MSDDTLPLIQARLGKLESQVLQEYERAKDLHQKAPVYVTLPEESARAFLEQVSQLYQQLIGGGDVRFLQLVTDLHDELRIRAQVLRDLLERDIPFQYLDRVLNEIRDTRHIITSTELSGAGAAPVRSETAEVTAGGGLLSSLPVVGKWFTRPAEKPDVADRAGRGKPGAQAEPEQGQEESPLSLDSMRTIGLHYLMEEDHSKLVKTEQLMPRLSHGIKLPAAIARYVTQDLTASHFATRVRQGIARTPEELRRKLAEREREEKS